MPVSRRQFLETTAAGGAAASLTADAGASPACRPSCRPGRSARRA